MAAPKLFISYCWTDQTHEQWVIDFATELRDSHVDVILDKWDLKEGHDAIHFMEQMVSDPEVKKVVIICNEQYVVKAAGRLGGVGTETQIISAEVYQLQKQDKFVALVRERDADGNAFLPPYYKSRIYIDLSSDAAYADNFEKLLRWIFDKPLNLKPPLGAPPSFLSDGISTTLGTGALFKRCLEAVKQQKPHAAGAFNEYCQTFAENLERFRITAYVAPLDEEVIRSINEFVPFRNEAIQLFIAVSQYSPTPESAKAIHRLFEMLLPYVIYDQGVATADNFKFVVHELFLYALAILLKYDRIELATSILELPFYLAGDYNSGMSSFSAFRRYAESFEKRNERLKTRRISLRADFLKERSVGTGVEFRHLLQADFVLFMRAELSGSKWWPETLLWATISDHQGPYEVFARSSSESYFKRSRGLLGVASPNDLRQFLERVDDGTRRMPDWDHHTFDPAKLLGADQLATRP